MLKPQPHLAVDKLQSELNYFVIGISRTDVYNKLEYTRLLNLATELQGRGGDVIKGCTHRAFLYSATGQFDQAEAMWRNLEKNNAHHNAQSVRLYHFANHGYATQALALADQVFAHRVGDNFVTVAQLILTAGGFGTVVAKIKMSQLNQEVLVMTDTVLDLARQGAAALAELGTSDAQMAAMIDVAGKILRDNKLYWKEDLPDMTVLTADQGGPALAFEYRVDVTPARAAQLSWGLAEELVSQGLERPGVAIGFLGTRLQARLAA